MRRVGRCWPADTDRRQADSGPENPQPGTRRPWVGRAWDANCRGCGSEWDVKQTAPVGSFKPSPSGLYDMHGNVYEWVADSWHKNYEGAPIDGSARAVPDESQFVSRGGSYFEIPSSLYVFSRNWSDGNKPLPDIGMRLVMER